MEEDEEPVLDFWARVGQRPAFPSVVAKNVARCARRLLHIARQWGASGSSLSGPSGSGETTQNWSANALSTAAGSASSIPRTVPISGFHSRHV